MARIKRGVRRIKASPQGHEARQGLPRGSPPQLSGRQRSAAQIAGLCVPRSSRPQARFPFALDQPHQRGRPREGISYSVFMHGLKKSGVTLNRKALAELAVSDQKAFGALLNLARQASQK